MSELKSYFLNEEIPDGLVRVVCASGHEAALAERDAEIEKLQEIILDMHNKEQTQRFDLVKHIEGLEALVQKMKCCFNCKGMELDRDDPDAGCDGCVWPYSKWELRT